MRTLLFKFAGPLQSWGTSSHFETRHTDQYPSKSAVIGMIAASLGYRRDDSQNIQRLNELDFGVRLDQIGGSLRDYHIAQKYKKNGNFERTYVTNRYYLEDAIFVVAVGHKDISLINKIESAVKSPYFQPFMGRRSLPLPYDFFIGIQEAGVIESLGQVPWQASSWYRTSQRKQLTAFVDSDLVTDGPVRMRKDRVHSFSQSERKFGFRGETKIDLDINNNIMHEPVSDKYHDAFGAIGG